MNTPGRSAGIAITVLLLLAGVAALGYLRWASGIIDGDRALADGRWEPALAAYATAEARLDRVPALKQLLAPEYDRVIANQLWLLYRLQQYDDVIARAERAPARAAPHFWSGLAFFAKGRAETTAAGQLGALARSEEELRRAVEGAPADWDTKYDFELVTRLAAELRRVPRTPPNQLMQLLRPQPKPGTKPSRRVG